MAAEVIMKASKEDQERAGARWQVIFKTHGGQDYCRMTKLMAHYNEDTIQTYAKNQINAFHSVIGGAVIEAW